MLLNISLYLIFKLYNINLLICIRFLYLYRIKLIVIYFFKSNLSSRKLTGCDSKQIYLYITYNKYRYHLVICQRAQIKDEEIAVIIQDNLFLKKKSQELFSNSLIKCNVYL